MNRKYALIVGHGRSGTNWLLRMMDQSPQTFCRNESNKVEGSPLGKLQETGVVITHKSKLIDLDQSWDDAITWTTDRMGSRDHDINTPKQYIYAPSRFIGLDRLVMKPTIRHSLALFCPKLRGGEWRFPWWLGSRHRLREAVGVIKLVQVPGWTTFVLEHRPSVPVLHIIRHPGGFLNSWRSRYLMRKDTNAVEQANHQRLKTIAAEDPHWSDQIGDIDRLSVYESELWYWCYANEKVYEAGKTSKQYHRIVYEDLVANPVTRLQKIYQACDLDWSPFVEQSIRKHCSHSKQIMDKWRDKLEPEQRVLVERMLDRPTFQGWWPNDHDSH